MTRRQRALDRGVERLMGLDSPTYGDERERGVFMEASAFGATVGIYTWLLAAAIAAVLGQLLLPVVLMVLALVPSQATLWYSRRRGVDLLELAERGGPKERLPHTVAIFALLTLTLGAMFYTVAAGHGLLVLPPLELPDGGPVDSILRGALVGGIGGGLVGVVMTARKTRNRRAVDIDVEAEEE